MECSRHPWSTIHVSDVLFMYYMLEPTEIIQSCSTAERHEAKQV